MAQANFLMGMAYGHIKDISSAKKWEAGKRCGTRYLRNPRAFIRAVEITRRYNIRFVPASEEGRLDSLPEFTEEVHERVAFLAHILHLETAMQLVDKPLPKPSGANFKEHIEHELPVSRSPLLWRHTNFEFTCRNCSPIFVWIPQVKKDPLILNSNLSESYLSVGYYSPRI